MAIVEICAEEGTAPVRLDVGSVQAVDQDDTELQDFYDGLEARGIFGKPAAVVSRQLYEEAIKMACSVVVQTEQQLATLTEDQQPDEFEVTFALQVDAGLDVKVVHLGSEAQVQVRVQWNRKRSA